MVLFYQSSYSEFVWSFWKKTPPALSIKLNTAFMMVSTIIISVKIKYLFRISKKEKKNQVRGGDESIGYLHKLWKYPSNEIKRSEINVTDCDMSKDLQFTTYSKFQIFLVFEMSI